MPTITDQQLSALVSATKSLATKYRLDTPANYLAELEILTSLVKEIQDQNYYDDGSPRRAV
jgi:hypothetical protein